MGDPTTTWRDLLLDQLDFYWQAHLWPRLQGLSDEEYLWEPVAGAWSLRTGEDGVVRIESVVPEPPVPPVTTIAWRLAHVGRDVLGKRARAFFGEGAGFPPPADGADVGVDDPDMYDDRHWPEPLPLTAAGGLALLEEGYTLWRSGVAGLDDEELLRPLGPRGGPFADDSMAALVQHLNRETMAHGAEICLLRDLYRAEVARHPAVRAALAGRAVDVEHLLDAPGAAHDLSWDEPSLLADVAALHRWDAVRALVSRGFPVESSTDAGATALHYAAAAGEISVVRELLALGADPTTVEATFGMPPAGWADYLGHGDTARLLAEAAERWTGA